MHHPQGGTFTIPKDSVKHFADDLNQVVDVPEHPSNAAINTVREGKGHFLGKGDDGLVFDTHDGNVAKVTTVVPYNLQNFRHHTHAVADARKQAELNNQAHREGHDVFLPQQFIEHGEKGFTIRPKLDLGSSLSAAQIGEYREKMKQAWDAGWRINDSVQHGVDAEGRIRVYDTGKMTKVSPSQDLQQADYDDWGQRTHARSLMKDQGHYDEQSDSDDIRDFLSDDGLNQLAWHNSQEATEKINPLQTFAPSQWKQFTNAIKGLIENESDELAFHVDDIRELFDEIESHVAATRQQHPAGSKPVPNGYAEILPLRSAIDKYEELREGGIQQSDLINFDNWLQKNQSNLWFDEDYGNGDDKYISAEGYLLEQLKEMGESPLTKLAAMNPGVLMSVSGFNPKIELLGHPSSEQLSSIEEWVEDNNVEVLDVIIYDEKGNKILDEQIEDEDFFEGAEVAGTIEEYFKKFPVSQDRRNENLKKWASGSKLVDDAGFPVVLYHGTQRPDRIGNQFRSDRATSGPMAYFTTNPEVASSYAENKSDTSLAYEDDEADQILNAFTVDGLPLLDAWHTLSEAEQLDLKNNLGKVYYDYDKEKYLLDEEGGNAPLNSQMLQKNADNTHYMNFQNQSERILKGNIFAALYDYWIHGGLLHPHDRYTELRDVLDAAGLRKTRTKYNDPYGSYSAVFPVYIRMQNPLQSHKVPMQVSQAINEASQQQEKLQEWGADAWDKNKQDPTEWAKLFEQATQHTKYKNDNSFIWTSIPDWATEVFKGLGYDGITDSGNKGGGKLEHEVIIPFTDEQVKSASGNYGRFRTTDKRITYAAVVAKDTEGENGQPLHPAETSWEPIKKETQTRATKGGAAQATQSKAFAESREAPAIDPSRFEKFDHASDPPPESHDPESQEAKNALKQYWRRFGTSSEPSDSATIADALVNAKFNAETKLGATEEDKAKYAELDYEHLEFLDRIAHPDEPLRGQHENDDFLYHVASSSFKHHSETPEEFHLPPGEVQLFEKSFLGKQIDQHVANNEWEMNTIASRTKRRIQEHELALENHPNHYNKNEIEEDIERLKKIDSHYDDIRKGHKEPFFVHRVHKSQVPGYETQDADKENTGSLTVDRFVNNRVRHASEKAGRSERSVSNAMSLRNALNQESKELDEVTDQSYKNYRMAAERCREAIKSLYADESLSMTSESFPDSNQEKLKTLAYGEAEKVLEKLTTIALKIGISSSIKSTSSISNFVAPLPDDLLWRITDPDSSLLTASNANVREMGVSSLAFEKFFHDLITAMDNKELWEKQNSEQLEDARTKIARGQLEKLQFATAKNPDFWRWAGDTKAIDEEGLPLIVFHGTSSGGFDEMKNLDVPGHVYGSTNPEMAASYSGFNYDDVTPALANSAEDIRKTTELTKYFILQQDQNEFRVYDVNTLRPLIDWTSQEDLVVEWNQFLLEKSPGQSLRSQGVYPLVYKIENPMVIKGDEKSWNQLSFDPDSYEDMKSALDSSAGKAVLKAAVGNSLDPKNVAKWFIRGINATYLAEFENNELSEVSRRAVIAVEDAAKSENVDLIVQAGINQMQNLMPELDYTEHLFEQFPNWLEAIESLQTTRDWAKVAEEAGHDGIVFEQILDWGDSPDGLEYDELTPNDVYVAFSETQVKSAYAQKFADSGSKSRRLTY